MKSFTFPSLLPAFPFLHLRYFIVPYFLRFLSVLKAEQLRGLVELEPSCKWPKLTLAATLTRLQAALLQTSTSGVEGDAAGEAGAASEEGAAYLAELADMDPLRKGYYASLLAGPHSHGGAA